MISSVSADIDFNIRQSCQSTEEPIFSMHDKQGGNIGMPGYYQWQVCGEDVEHAEIRDSCKEGENSFISMFQKNDSHAAIDQTYRWDVCIPQVKTNLSQSCSNPVASMHSKTDSHVAEPNHYKWQLCPSTVQPENVSIKLEFDAGKTYIDNTKAEEKTYNPIELAYPYIISDQPAGIVSYGELLQMEYINKSASSKVFKTTQSTDSSSVLLPFTKGGYKEIEDEENMVTDRTFLNKVSSSFSYSMGGESTVKVRKIFQETVEGFEDTETNYIELSIRNKVNNNDSVEIVVNPVG